MSSLSSGRRLALLAAALGGLLLVGLAVITRGLVDTAATPVAPTRDEMCAEYENLVAELDSNAVFATQAAIRSTRKLSQMAGLYARTGGPDAPSPADGEPPVAQADADLRRVLQSVAWETSDLIAASRPVALECGWVWPTTATPPAVQPQPPAS